MPVGLFSAVYMSEYASQASAHVVKPLLEMLAGIPTIVYGFFALVTVGPFLRDSRRRSRSVARSSSAISRS